MRRDQLDPLIDVELAERRVRDDDVVQGEAVRLDERRPKALLVGVERLPGRVRRQAAGRLYPVRRGRLASARCARHQACRARRQDGDALVDRIRPWWISSRPGAAEKFTHRGPEAPRKYE